MRRAALDPALWVGRRVLVTGHTGFKGAWISLVLKQLGAVVTGFALAPKNKEDLFNVACVAEALSHVVGDVRDFDALNATLENSKPEIVIHMAAQAIVRTSYVAPVETYATNVMGTVNLLEAIRSAPSVRAVVVVTSDKCYQNREWEWGYREYEALGGHDPYSSSKACAELVTAAYRASFLRDRACGLASARAGNVIGGGDWSSDRLVPDAVRAFTSNQMLRIRNPNAVRPWQHVLEPITGYLLLSQHLFNGDAWAGDAWNFGPSAESEVPVSNVVERLVALWGGGASWCVDDASHPHEASYLKLDCSKTRLKLAWKPTLDIQASLAMSVALYRAQTEGTDARGVAVRQVSEFLGSRFK